MNKLFSCQFGSRLYGTATPQSDLDIKHVVLPNIDDLLLCKEVKNKVKKTNKQENTKNTKDDVDEEFIPIQVFARDFFAGQTYAIELAFAIDGVHAGQEIFDPRGAVKDGSVWIRDINFEEWDKEVPYIVKFVHELREKFLTSNIKAMTGYVVNQASQYSFKGERYNATKALYFVLEELILIYGVNTKINELPKDKLVWISDSLAVKYPKYFSLTDYDIGSGIRKPCFMLLERTIPHTDSLSHAKTVVEALLKKYGDRAKAASADNVDWKATMHAVRIVNEGISILRDQTLEFPFSPDYVTELLQIKRGEADLDEIKVELTVKLDMLKNLQESTLLPTETPELRAEFEEWLLGWMRRFYDL